MDQAGDGFAYRCLPLNIANAHGWLILNPTPFIAEWDGNAGLDAVTVRPIGPDGTTIAASHFGVGVLTLQVNALFRTEPGYDLMVTGPFNQTKDALQPLTGMVETDWSPFTFTMNWKFTRKHTPVSFDRGEPFCMIVPVRRGLIEAVQPEFRALDQDPEVRDAFAAWADSRRAFNAALQVPGSEAQAEKWQKDYFKGGARFGESPPDHRTRLRPAPFTPLEPDDRRWNHIKVWPRDRLSAAITL